MTDLAPIRKLVAAAVGAGLTWVAFRLGIPAGPAEVEQAAAAVVGLLFGYLVPDPRVVGSGM